MTANAVLLKNRCFLRLTGADTLEFLRGLVTQSLANLSVEQALYSLLLTPQGKIVADFFITTNGDDIVLEADAAVGAALLQKLSLYRLRADVHIVDESSQWAAAAIWGGRDAGRNDAPGAVLDYGPEGLIVYDDPRLAAMGLRVKARPDALPRLFERMNATETGLGAFDAHRRHLGVPRFGEDFTAEQVFPMDMNMDLLNAVDYRKGCFVGQEVASRMKRKGEVRKRVLIADFAGAAPARGTEIMAEGSTLGEVLSSAGETGLALIRLDRLEKAGGMQQDFTAAGGAVRLRKPVYMS